VAALLLGMSAVAAAKPQDGQVFQDWTVNCQAMPEKPTIEACFIRQNIVETESKEPVMQVAVGYLGADGAPAALVSLPLGIRLPPGVELAVDKEPQGELQFERCLPNGCQVQFLLDDKLLSAFRSGIAGEVTFQDGTGRAVAVPFSLKGFTAAFNSLK
jgi:invasion protein IalB